MSDVAIRVEDLGKEYRLGGRSLGYKTLRETLAESASIPMRAIRRGFGRRGAGKGNESNTIWALKDVSFEIRQGDVIGIIGRNGAGKSTLLKILSRITEPTKGCAEIYGRIGSLLEVGTGFHPELTGRENIFLNGAILGMGRKEIQRKFDQIVDFAGVERFLDTPVKHFSSGMYLRLAFAVAAHLDPEILLVDEVLAVGDVAFQQKCLRRMDDVARDGRTVLFVSHHMAVVRSLCDKGMFLNEGRIEESGDLSACITRYFRSVGVLEEEESNKEKRARHGFGRVVLNGDPGNTIDHAEAFVASAMLRLPEKTIGFDLFCLLFDMHGHIVFRVRISSQELGIHGLEGSEHRVSIEIPPLWLTPGLYSLEFKVGPWGQAGSKYVSDKFPVDVTGHASTTTSQVHGFLHPKVNWSVERTCSCKPAEVFS